MCKLTDWDFKEGLLLAALFLAVAVILCRLLCKFLLQLQQLFHSICRAQP